MRKVRDGVPISESLPFDVTHIAVIHCRIWDCEFATGLRNIESCLRTANDISEFMEITFLSRKQDVQYDSLNSTFIALITWRYRLTCNCRHKLFIGTPYFLQTSADLPIRPSAPGRLSPQ